MKMRVFFAIGVAVVLLTAGVLAQSGQRGGRGLQPGQAAQNRAPAEPRPLVGRSVVSTQFGIVAASHPLAARAGVEMLERGGNAVDAAIAANATIGLMEPSMNGIGGDLFVLFYEAKTGKLHGLNASGYAPTGLTPKFLQDKNITRMPGSGIYSVTVPGVIAGWHELRAKFGTKPFSEILAPAIYYADNGFPVTEVIARGWAGSVNKLSQHAPSAKTFLIDGRAPRAGEIFKNLDLAKSLRYVADEGRDGFYKGPTAQAILQLAKEQGGTMTAADLAEYKPEWVTPISTTYRGWTVYEIPPSSTGIAALMMLNIMEQYPLKEYGFHSTKALHVMIEAKKLAYADLIRYIGDPAFSKLPTDMLLSKAHGAQRSKLIDPSKAACTIEPAKLEGYTNSEGNDTIYLSAIDEDGNIVSLIQSNYSGFGSGLTPPGTGFVLHNRGGLFTLEPNHPNTLAPRKRPLHTIIPAFMEKDGTRIGFGIMGGFNQPQAHAQFVANIADYGFTIQEALEAGRFTKGSFQGCDVSIEPLVPENVRRELTALGHELNVTQFRSGTFGHGQVVMSNPAGVHFGASEPRHDGAAIPQMAPVFGTKK
ncbi:MAG: gamma-glutamyltransferase [Acidobacteria bacterium]|nr:gamma-glutamyltransferase [Acidobacteriota bacterium]